MGVKVRVSRCNWFSGHFAGLNSFVVLACLFIVPRLGAIEPRLLPVGAPWRFQIGAEDSPPLPADWRERNFDDSAWTNGISGFSTYLSEPSMEATYLGRTTMTSACFRATFEVPNPEEVQWLVLRVDYVSGFVAFLNGREIARRGVEGNPPALDAVATDHARQATEALDVSIHRDALVAGTNVLAIQLHGSTVPATGLVLVPELCANFTRGPFIQNVSTQAAEILWRTPSAATTVVEFGETPALGQSFTEASLTTNHVAALTGLLPDTDYFYRVRSLMDSTEAASPVYRFHTLRLAGDISYAVFGDSGSGWMPQLRVASCLATAGVDLVLHAGDLTYPNLNRAIVDTRCLSIYTPQMRGTPYFFTPGNHDLYAPDTLATYLETFHMPTNDLTGTMHFYSFNHGDVHFVSLFAPSLQSYTDTAAYVMSPGSLQLQWLTNDLASTRKPWRILLLHIPPFDSTFHQFDDYNLNGLPDRLELQHCLLPVATQFGVQVIFSGHAHDYERFAPVDGVHCFVTGGGGYSLYGLAQRDPLSQRFESRFHYLKAAITGQALEIQAVDQFGIEFDTVIIPRVSPPRVRATLVGNRTLRLDWNAASGMRYQVETAETPNGPFVSLENPALPVTATNYHVVFDLGWGAPNAEADARFFRVRMLTP